MEVSMKLIRRDFLKVAGSSLLVAAAARLAVPSALAAEKKKSKKSADAAIPAGQAEVPASDPVATAIGYVGDVSKVDKAKYPQYKAGQDCSKCALYVASNEGWGKCQMITTGLVKAGGWCGSFNPKPAG